ncbi:hypothetical protein D3C71_1050260 [compost metagenome]
MPGWLSKSPCTLVCCSFLPTRCGPSAAGRTTLRRAKPLAGNRTRSGNLPMPCAWMEPCCRWCCRLPTEKPRSWLKWHLSLRWLCWMTCLLRCPRQQVQKFRRSQKKSWRCRTSKPPKFSTMCPNCRQRRSLQPPRWPRRSISPCSPLRSMRRLLLLKLSPPPVSTLFWISNSQTWNLSRPLPRWRLFRRHPWCPTNLQWMRPLYCLSSRSMTSNPMKCRARQSPSISCRVPMGRNLWVRMYPPKS